MAKNTPRVQTHKIKTYTIRYGYMLLFLPAVLATVAFGVYYYLTIYTTIVESSANVSTVGSTQIQNLTTSVEAEFHNKQDSANSYANSATQSPF